MKRDRERERERERERGEGEGKGGRTEGNTGKALSLVLTQCFVILFRGRINVLCGTL
jgi:hypothetical protein